MLYMKCFTGYSHLVFWLYQSVVPASQGAIMKGNFPKMAHGVLWSIKVICIYFLCAQKLIVVELLQYSY